MDWERKENDGKPKNKPSSTAGTVLVATVPEGCRYRFGPAPVQLQ